MGRRAALAVGKGLGDGARRTQETGINGRCAAYFHHPARICLGWW